VNRPAAANSAPRAASRFQAGEYASVLFGLAPGVSSAFGVSHFVVRSLAARSARPNAGAVAVNTKTASDGNLTTPFSGRQARGVL